ncbi:methyl-accepting chemotaxis protein [Tritonibacter litoralis]|nr:methyl-accepting chemotaxis protein [Tritonibacter litoralis]
MGIAQMNSPETPQADTQADTLAEAELGQLINLCGKMRMLSHRAVMIALLQNCEDPRKTLGGEAFAAALDEFAAIAQRISLTRAHSDLPPDVLVAMRAVQAITPEQEQQLEKFINAARDLSNSGNRADQSRLVAFAEFVATTLLSTLNDVVGGIGRALDYAVAQRSSRSAFNRDVISKSVSQIEQISQAVFMISVNASIEAARAGEQGRGFSILASEIRSLSQTSATSVQQLRSQLEVLAS